MIPGDLYIPKTAAERAALSPALSNRFPESCSVTTESLAPVPLSTAGWLLNFGTTYRLSMPATVRNLTLTSYPKQFIRLHRSGTTDRHSRDERFEQFRVIWPGWFECLTHHGSYAHDLEWEATFTDESKTNGTIPVVLQMRRSLLFLIVALLFSMVTAIVSAAWEVAFGGNISRLLEPKTWILAIVAACVYLILWMPKRWWTLHSREAQLRQAFNEKWKPHRAPSPSPG